MDAVEISRTGLDVEWQRLQVIAQNLANASSSRAGSADPYRAVRLMSGPKVRFSQLVDSTPQGVAVQGLTPIGSGVRRVQEPGHPHADAQGFVTYPDIDRAGEMTLMIQTSRAYEANLTAMSTAQQMYARALELGRQS